jgi:hypothetical protein
MITTTVGAYANGRIVIPLNLSNWAAAYPLSEAEWWAQVRAVAYPHPIVIDFRKPPNSIVYIPMTRVAIFSAPWVDGIERGGAYEWDYGFTVPGIGPVHISGGPFSILRGISKPAGA